MKTLLKTWILPFLLFLAACKNPPAKPTEEKRDAPDCPELAEAMIKSSSYKNFLGQKTDLVVESVTDSLITMHETWLNEDDRDVTVAWLQIDLKQGVIRNVTVDPDSPDVYKITDLKKFKELQEACK